jgi:hypothetical protein
VGLESARTKAAGNELLLKDIDALSQKLDLLVNGPKAKPGTPVPVTDFSLTRTAAAFSGLLDVLQNADVAPSTQAVAASADLQTALTKSTTAWETIQSKDLPVLNTKLKAAGLAPIDVGPR